MKKKSPYPRLKQIGITLTVHTSGFHYVLPLDLNAALEKHNIREQFNKLFGVQTCCMEGPYASDCESVLERIFSGKLTGSQLEWD